MIIEYTTLSAIKFDIASPRVSGHKNFIDVHITDLGGVFKLQ